MSNPLLACGLFLLLTISNNIVPGKGCLGQRRHAAERQEKAAPSSPDLMVLIPGGTFPMGDSMGLDYEKPAHTVRISDFYLSKYEVTVAEFKTFVEATAYQTDAEKAGKSWVYDGRRWREIPGLNWRHDPEGQLAAGNLPVVHISWNDATAFCQWMAEKTGRAYRLPTEAEWEYAAGNGARHTRYSWGDGPPASSGGNVADESGKRQFPKWEIFDGYADGYVFTAPVGSFPANDFDLYDMTGNVWEWCSDWYDSDYYQNSPAADPPGPPAGMYRVLRGGAWRDMGLHCRVAARSSFAPGYTINYVGFRVARGR